MRVMQVIAGAGVGGAETFFVDLVGALHRAKLEQRVIIRRNERRAAALRALGLIPIELPFRRWLDFDTSRRLRREIESFQPDVVQTWMSRASAALPRGNFVHVGWLGGYYDLKSFRRCDHLIGVTKDISAHAVASGAERRDPQAAAKYCRRGGGRFGQHGRAGRRRAVPAR